MVNPFERTDAHYFVLSNQEGQFSLWPAFAAIPSGWSAQLGPENRGICLEFIESNWTDMRPKSLVCAMDSATPPNPSNGDSM